MAGIVEATKRVMQRKNVGVIVAMEGHFALITLESGELHGVHDYGGDVRLAEGLKLHDRVRLCITSLKSAEWRKDERSSPVPLNALERCGRIREWIGMPVDVEGEDGKRLGWIAGVGNKTYEVAFDTPNGSVIEQIEHDRVRHFKY